MTITAEAKAPAATTVLIIDDHPFVLQGCARILEDAGLARVVQASTLADGFRQYRTHSPHLIIVDLSIKSAMLGGLSFVRRLRLHDKKTPILVLSMHRDPMIVRRALDLGVTGFVLKDAPSDEFLSAFHHARQGKAYLSHDVASDMVFSAAKSTASPFQALTLRELQMLQLLADGKPYGVIAQDLNVSYKTVANTCSLIKSKLGARSLPELMRIALKHLPETPNIR
jgi:DNA-binding NarL/FixJ family response regulator